MPTANYRNTKTNEIVEILTKGAPEPEMEISGVKYIRTYEGNNVSFSFKGAGFYENDYKKKPAPPKE